MALSERLAILITADTAGAVRNIEALGRTAERDLARVDRAAGGPSARLDSFGNKAITAGATMTAFGAVAARGLYGAATAAQDLADSVDKAQATFGQAGASGLTSWAETASTDLGKSKAAALDAASAYGLLLKQQGIGGAALAGQASALATRTADIAEQLKKPYEEVQKSIETVLKTGNVRSLKGLLGLDIQIDPNSLKGLDTASRTAKVLDEVMRQTADSAGFFAKSTDDVGAQVQVMQAKWEDAKASFGEASLPALTSLADAATGLLDMFNALPGPVKTVVGELATFATIGALIGGPISTAVGGVAGVFRGIAGDASDAASATGAATGATGALSAAAGPATIALVAGAAAFEAWASAAAESAQVTRDVVSALTELNAVDPSAPVFSQKLFDVFTGAGNSDVQDALDKSGVSLANISALLESAPGKMDKFREKVIGFGGALERLDTGGRSWSDIFDPNLFSGPRSQADLIRDINDAAADASPQIGAFVKNMTGLVAEGKLTGQELRIILERIAEVDEGAGTRSKGIATQAEQLKKVAGEASRSATALALFKVATNENAGLDAQRAAFDDLLVLLPEAAASLGLAGDASSGLGTDAAAAASGVDALTASVIAAVDGAETSVDRYTKAAQAAAAPARAAIAAESALLRVADAQDKLAKLNDPAERNRKVADALDKVASANDSLTDAIERRQKAQEKLDSLSKRSAVAGSVPLLQQITKAADAEVKAAEKRIADLVSGGAGADELAKAQRNLDEARSRRGEAAGLLDQGLAESKQATQREIRDARTELDKATRDVDKARKSKADAESDYSGSLKDGTTTARERRQAELDLQTALIDAGAAAATYAGYVADGIDPAEALATAVQNLGDAAGTAQGNVAKFAELVSGILNDLGAGGTAPGAPGGAGTSGPGGTVGPANPNPYGYAARPEPGHASLDPLAPIRNLPLLGWTTSEYQIGAPAEVQRLVKAGNWSAIVDIFLKRGAKVPGFATGGMVGGYGGTDSQLARLTPGEFVMTPTAVNRIGVATLTAFNKGTPRGPGSVPTTTRSSTQARGDQVTINVTSTEPRRAADEVVRRMRQRAFLAGTR